MAGEPRHLVLTKALKPEEATHLRHPLNPKSDIRLHSLGDRAGMKRNQLHLARLAPGAESFVLHWHELQEEFVFILEGTGRAPIGAAGGRRHGARVLPLSSLGQTGVYNASGGKFYDEKTVQALVYPDFVAKDP